MKIFLMYVILFFSITSSISQEIDFNELNFQILTKVNELRAQKSIHPLAIDDILNKAAIHHNKYLVKTNKLSHKEKKIEVREPSDRVDYYYGSHSIVGENILYVNINNESESIDSIASRIVISWVNSKKHYQNMINDHFYTSGISTKYSKNKKRIYATHVFGSQSFEKTDIPYNIKNYGVNKEFNGKVKAIDTIPEYYHHGINIDSNNVIYYYFSDKKYFQKNIPNNFKFSADIIFRNQFPCNQPNILHRSPAYDGYFTQPIKAKHIIKNNIAPANYIESPIGIMPEGFRDKEFESNLVISKKNKMLRYFTFSPSIGANLNIMSVDLYRDTVYQNTINSNIIKDVKFTLHYEQGESLVDSNEINPICKQLNLNKYNIHSAKIIGLSSVEGQFDINKELYKKRAKNIIDILSNKQLDTIPTKIIALENWKEFNKDINKTPLKFLKDSSRQFVKTYLKDNYNPTIENILQKHRKSIVFLKISEKQIPVSIYSVADSINKYATDSTNTVKALYYQLKLHDSIMLNTKIAYLLDSVEIPFKKFNIHLLNHRMIIDENFESRKWSLYKVNNLRNLAKNEQLVLFNCYGLLAKRWYNNPNTIIEFKQIEKGINKLKNHPQISEGQWKKLIMNFQISCAIYYMRNQLYKQERRSVNIIRKNYLIADLTQNDGLILANYFVFHSMFKNAHKLLLKYINKDNVEENLLFYFITIAIYDDEYSKSEKFAKVMNKASALNEKRFCDLFNSDFTFQLLRNNHLKNKYCEICQ